jgi:hypothetical protein
MSASFQRCGCAAKTREDIANDFIKQIKAGNITPDLMAEVLYAMQIAMVDRFESVSMLIPINLETVADEVVKAIRIDEEQPSPEEQQMDAHIAELGVAQSFESWMKRFPWASL